MAVIIGLDVGDVRIGVALSDPDELIALAHGAILRSPTAFAELEALARAEGVRQVVVGLPRRLDGTQGPQAEATRRFMQDWEDFLTRHDSTVRPEIIWWDERYSSVAAQRALQSGAPRGKRQRSRNSATREADRQRIDATAAAIILQTYLDYARNRRVRNGEFAEQTVEQVDADTPLD